MDKNLRQRVIALLTREEIDFLDKLGKDALFSCGSKFTRTKLISALIKTIMQLGIDGRKLKTSADLEEKIKAAIFKSVITAPLSRKPETGQKQTRTIETRNNKPEVENEKE